MRDEVLDFWFGTPATNADEFKVKIKRWFMGGPTLDAEIRERFGTLVARAIAGELDDWAAELRGRLALILLLDQFTRSVYRDDPRMYDGDAKAQTLAVEAFDRGLDRKLSIEERNFLLMPLTHAENRDLQERSVKEFRTLYDQAAPWQQAMLNMGLEQTTKYREVITKFGRFPHRNKLLGRASSPEEAAFLIDWEQKMRPKDAAKL